MIGINNKKFLSDMSLQEAINEGLYQLKNSKYIQNLLSEHQKHFDELIMELNIGINS